LSARNHRLNCCFKVSFGHSATLGLYSS